MDTTGCCRGEDPVARRGGGGSSLELPRDGDVLNEDISGGSLETAWLILLKEGSVEVLLLLLLFFVIRNGGGGERCLLLTPFVFLLPWGAVTGVTRELMLLFSGDRKAPLVVPHL